MYREELLREYLDNIKYPRDASNAIGLRIADTEYSYNYDSRCLTVCLLKHDSRNARILYKALKTWIYEVENLGIFPLPGYKDFKSILDLSQSDTIKIEYTINDRQLFFSQYQTLGADCDCWDFECYRVISLR